MAPKINLMHVPRGERSKLTNAALRAALTALRRRRAIIRLGELRAEAPALPAGEIVRRVRKDRASH